MPSRSFFCIVFVCTCLGLLAGAHPALSDGPEYLVVDLGTLHGAPTSTAAAISGGEQVVGQSDGLPYRWAGGVMTDLGSLGGGAGSAHDLNDAGHVVGSSLTAEGREYGFFWSAPGPMVEISPLGSGRKCWANGINGGDQVVGISTTHYYDLDTAHAFLWTPGGGTVDLGTLGGDKSGASDVNDAGRIVGGSTTATSSLDHAFFMSSSAGSMQDLGTLGGDYSYAHAVNASDVVVGVSTVTPGQWDYRAFVWTAEEGMINLGTLGGNSWAMDVNGSGEIVGKAYPTPQSTEPHAVYWGPDRGIVDLNTLIDPDSGWVLQTANGINDTGQIVGEGILDGSLRAYLLAPAVCQDLDQDGYGSPASPACPYPELDCDDLDPSVNPGATEGPAGDPTCSDQVDNDCDGLADEDPECTPPPFTLEMEAAYAAGNLSLDFEVGTPEPSMWGTYLIVLSPTVAVHRLWMLPLPALDPPVEVPVEFPFPAVGWIGIYTGLFTEAGVQAYGLEWVNTGGALQ